jgi:methylmalonyl-CoA mutase
MNTLYKAIMDKVHEKTNSDLKSTFQITREMSEKFSLFRHTERYLSEIAGATENTFQQLARTSGAKLYGIFKTLETVSGKVPKLTKRE